MPSTVVKFSEVEKALPEKSAETNIIRTSKGLFLIELQGELNVPHALARDAVGVSEEYRQLFATVDEIQQAVKFGRLEFDHNSRAVLYVGKSQRIIGDVEELKEPLGVMKVPTKPELGDIEIIDVVYSKIIFKSRPLPVL